MRIPLIALLLSCRMFAGYSFCVPVTFNNHPASTLTDFPAMFCANGSTGAFCDLFAGGVTARLLGDPIALTIRVIDAIGYYTKAGAPWF